MKNRFSTRVVATYVEEQLHNGNGSDLLVCAGSSSSVMMSSALIAMWCPAIRDIFMAEPGNPPDAVIFPDLSPEPGMFQNMPLNPSVTPWVAPDSRLLVPLSLNYKTEQT